MTRSNSVTTAVQADLDDPDYYPVDAPEMAMRHSATMPRQYSRDSATSTVSIQGSGNHYHALTVEEYGEVGVDPSILPPPDPWMDQVDGPMEVVGGRGSLCPRDGRWFLKLLQAETDRMEGWCRQMEQDEQENELPDDGESAQSKGSYTTTYHKCGCVSVEAGAAYLCVIVLVLGKIRWAHSSHYTEPVV